MCLIKIATLTYNTLTFGHPAYLCELISPYQPSRLLRSGKQLLLTVPHAKLATGQHAFSYSSPVIWNAIPLFARDAPSIAHSSVASNHSILTHSSPNLNIRHLATACASDLSYMLDYVARYKFLYICGCSLSTLGPVSTWMGDCLPTGKPAR